MKRHLNLMSDQARWRENKRQHRRQWSWVLAATTIVLLQLGLVKWWGCHRDGQHREATEMLYEPIRQLKAENSQLQRQIDALQQEQRVPLALANERPVTDVLGMVGQAAAESDGQIYVQQLRLQEEPLKPTSSKATPATVVLQGVGLHSSAISQFADSLRTTLLFTSVELASTHAIKVHQQPRQAFTIRCSY